MTENPYQSPKATDTRPKPVQSSPSSLAWWESRRLDYNLGLIAAGLCAYFCYLVVCTTLLSRVAGSDEMDYIGFATLVQGIGYLFAMGVANVCYFLGPLSEFILRPSHTDRYRRVCYRLGFWFSVMLPFGIPIDLLILILFFPEHWDHIP